MKVLSVKKRQYDTYKSFTSNLSKLRKRIIIWGINSVLWNSVSDIVKVDDKCDYAVDNNSHLWDKVMNGLVVRKPDELLTENKEQIVIVVLSLKYYLDIKQQLESYGFIENEHFYNGQLLLPLSQGGIGGYY